MKGRNKDSRFISYESETIVRDGMVAVPPDLDGQRVRIIVIPLGDDAVDAPSDPMEALFAAAIPGVTLTPFTRDQAYER